MKQWKLWLGIVAIILSAAAVGGVGAAFYIHREMSHIRGGGPAMKERMMFMRFSRVLELDPDQEREVQKILKETRRELKEARERFHQEGESIWARGQQRIRPLLREDQHARMERFNERIRRRRGKMLGMNAGDKMRRESGDGPLESD